MIIGLTGTIASGKTTIAEFLKNEGWEHFTYSDILRNEAEKKNINPTRENLQKLGNEMKKGHLGILSKLIVETAKTEKIIADGIRTVDEINELKKFPNAFIIGVDAPQEKRFERLKARKRKGDPENFEEFRKIDDHENIGKTEGQNIGECIKKADIVINNDSSMEELKKKLYAYLNNLSAFLRSS